MIRLSCSRAKRSLVKSEPSLCRVFQIVLETVCDAEEGDIIPRNFVSPQHCNLEAFVTGPEIRGGEAPAVEQMNLIDVRDADHRERRVNNDSCTSFLMGFATSRFGSRFTIFVQVVTFASLANPASP